MRSVIPLGTVNLIKILNSNKEICKACKENNELKEPLAESVKVPIHLVEIIFTDLSIKDNEFKIIRPATKED